MDILNKLVEKFAITLESKLCDNADYLKAIALLHELAEKLTAEQSEELEDITDRLTSASFNVGVRSGLRLGARIAIGLLDSNK